MFKLMHALIKDQRGATSLEYCMIGFLISIIAITAMTNIGVSTNAMTSSVNAGFR
mgnify:CR=1